MPTNHICWITRRAVVLVPLQVVNEQAKWPKKTPPSPHKRKGTEM